jgi:hypothetical protein
MEYIQLNLSLGTQTLLVVLCRVRGRPGWPRCVLLAHCSCVSILSSTVPVLIEVDLQPKRVGMTQNLHHMSQLVPRSKPTRRNRGPSDEDEDARVAHQPRHAQDLDM